MLQEIQVRLGLKVLQEQGDSRVVPEHQDQWDLQDHLEILVTMVSQVTLDLQVRMVLLGVTVSQDCRVSQETEGLLVVLDLLGNRDLRVPLDNKDLKVHEEWPGHPVMLDRLGPKGLKETKDFKDLQVQLGILEVLVTKDRQDLWDRLETRVQPDQMDLQVIMSFCLRLTFSSRKCFCFTFNHLLMTS